MIGHTHIHLHIWTTHVSFEASGYSAEVRHQTAHYFYGEVCFVKFWNQKTTYEKSRKAHVAQSCQALNSSNQEMNEQRQR